METPCGNKGTPARKGGMSLEGEVDGRGMRPAKENDQRGGPHRSLDGLDCLGMLPATPANMREACGRHGCPSSGNRQPVATSFHERKSPG